MTTTDSEHGRQLRPHVHLHAAAQRHDPSGRDRRPRRQEPQGPVLRDRLPPLRTEGPRRGFQKTIAAIEARAGKQSSRPA